jgi:hypothetical protein
MRVFIEYIWLMIMSNISSFEYRNEPLDSISKAKFLG